MKTFQKNLLVVLLSLGTYFHSLAQDNTQKTIVKPVQAGTISMTDKPVTISLNSEVNSLMHDAASSSYTVMLTPVGCNANFIIKSKSNDNFVVEGIYNDAKNKSSELKFDYVVFVTATISIAPLKIYTSINDK